MAMLFELVAVFGDPLAAHRARALVARTGSVQVGHRWVPLTEQSRSPGPNEVTVWPDGLGVGGRWADKWFSGQAARDVDLDDVADQLYDLLKRFDGYLCAQVGWDPETDADLYNIQEAVADPDDRLQHCAGLVLAEELALRWSLIDGWEPFAPGHVWRPRRSFRAST